VPGDDGGALDDHETAERLSLPHPHTEQQHRQPLRPGESRTLPQLSLQDEHLLAEGEDLAVAIVPEQASDHRAHRTQEDEKQVPDHAARMREVDGEVDTCAESSPTATGGPKGHTGQFRGPTPQEPFRSVWDPRGFAA